MAFSVWPMTIRVFGGVNWQNFTLPFSNTLNPCYPTIDHYIKDNSEYFEIWTDVKQFRLTPQQPKWEGGDILFPARAPLLAEFNATTKKVSDPRTQKALSLPGRFNFELNQRKKL